ncbi:MAG: DUF721 domain-containing protein [Planctomycetes bacterium]|nr:DUF721 domain-containing protein [Planctomycetota bacterium]
MAKAKRRTKKTRIRDEAGPEWQRWFDEVKRRRERLTSPRYRPLVISRAVVDGEERVVARQKSVPVPVKKIVDQVVNLKALGISLDIESIREVWGEVVGLEIARDTALYSFKNGIVTIDVHSPTLFQELRAFYAEDIKKDLRDKWPLSVPLVDVKYRLARKSPS